MSLGYNISCVCYEDLNGISECIDSFGGVQAVWIIPKCELTHLTVDDGEIIGLTFGTTMSFYDFKQGQAMVDIESNIDFETGTSLFTTTLTINLKGQSLDKRNELILLSKYQQELVYIYLDEIGTYWAVGLVPDDRFGARVSAVNGSTGRLRTEANEYVLELTAVLKELPLVVDETLIPTVTP
jgi:hypothetical protein